MARQRTEAKRRRILLKNKIRYNQIVFNKKVILFLSAYDFFAFFSTTVFYLYALGHISYSTHFIDVQFTALVATMSYIAAIIFLFGGFLYLIRGLHEWRHYRREGVSKEKLSMVVIIPMICSVFSWLSLGRIAFDIAMPWTNVTKILHMGKSSAYLSNWGAVLLTVAGLLYIGAISLSLYNFFDDRQWFRHTFIRYVLLIIATVCLLYSIACFTSATHAYLSINAIATCRLIILVGASLTFALTSLIILPSLFLLFIGCNRMCARYADGPIIQKKWVTHLLPVWFFAALLILTTSHIIPHDNPSLYLMIAIIIMSIGIVIRDAWHGFDVYKNHPLSYRTLTMTPTGVALFILAFILYHLKSTIIGCTTSADVSFIVLVTGIGILGATRLIKLVQSYQQISLNLSVINVNLTRIAAPQNTM